MCTGSRTCHKLEKPVQLLTWRRRAAVIWDASVRRQMRSYRRHAAASSTRSSDPGVRAGSVGRIASCASCAFFVLVLQGVRLTGKHWSKTARTHDQSDKAGCLVARPPNMRVARPRLRPSVQGFTVDQELSHSMPRRAPGPGNSCARGSQRAGRFQLRMPAAAVSSVQCRTASG